MSTAQRYTTEYIDYEDRVRLTYIIQDGSTHVAWLTHRFLDRFISHSVTLLEKNVQPIFRGDALQAFAQDVAVSKLPAQPPVQAKVTTQAWVVYSVVFKVHEKTAELSFKSRDETCNLLISMSIEQLRQWLNILREQYIKANWSTTTWPDWLIERNQSTSESTKKLH